MKRILVISYSQSGQLHDILNYFLEPFEGLEVEQVFIEAQDPYAFPWQSAVFFDVMPETVLEEVIDLAPFSLRHQQYDLIVLGYQPWFLSPSLPTTALLKTPNFLAVVKDTPVVTVIGSRNMWINSQMSVVRDIQNAGGRMVGNIPFVDRTQNHISALTILHWMLTGKKERKWGFLPLPGVAEADIQGAGVFGAFVAKAVQENNFEGLQDKILAENKIELIPSIMLIEKAGKRLFMIWAKLIKKKGTNEKKRAFWVRLYKYYLLIALFLISPIVLLVYTLLIRPFTGGRIRRNRKAFLYLGIEPKKI